MVESTRISAAGAQQDTSTPDRVIMYASVFNYNPRDRSRILNYVPDFDKISKFESKCEF